MDLMQGQNGTHSQDACLENLDEEENMPTNYLLHGLQYLLQLVDISDSIINLALFKGFAPLSIFKDTSCKELCFPKIYFGEDEEKYTEESIKS